MFWVLLSDIDLSVSKTVHECLEGLFPGKREMMEKVFANEIISFAESRINDVFRSDDRDEVFVNSVTACCRVLAAVGTSGILQTEQFYALSISPSLQIKAAFYTLIKKERAAIPEEMMDKIKWFTAPDCAELWSAVIACKSIWTAADIRDFHGLLSKGGVEWGCILAVSKCMECTPELLQALSRVKVRDGGWRLCFQECSVWMLGTHDVSGLILETIFTPYCQVSVC